MHLKEEQSVVLCSDSLEPSVSLRFRCSYQFSCFEDHMDVLYSIRNVE